MAHADRLVDLFNAVTLRNPGRTTADLFDRPDHALNRIVAGIGQAGGVGASMSGFTSDKPWFARTTKKGPAFAGPFLIYMQNNRFKSQPLQPGLQKSAATAITCVARASRP